MPDDGFFDAHVAAEYDETAAKMFDPSVVEPTVEFLADLAGGGHALELGIGTGRIALPLARRGVPVHGIDQSTAMVARLKTKPGGDAIPVTIGDFATTAAGGPFSLAYVVFNTIMNLVTQHAQVACFQNTAAQLASGGRFVIEVMVPDLRRLPPGQTVRPLRVETDRLDLDEYDVAGQGLVSHHLRLVNGTWERRSIPFRYVWPSELDLMARLAGIEPEARWSGWRREPFTADSERLVAVWRKPAPPGI